LFNFLGCFVLYIVQRNFFLCFFFSVIMRP
jgi:hypothetical protein